ncbi:MAG: hypothetical protein ACK417_02615 [Bacteroidia bacterium]
MRFYYRFWIGIILLGCLSSLNLRAQEYYFKLKDQQLEISTKGFYLSAVRDVREVQGSIGTVLKGITNKPHQAHLSPDLEQALSTYLLPQFTPAEGLVGVELHINHLEIAEKIVLPIETGFIDMAVSFYHVDTAGAKLLYTTYYRSQESMKYDVTFSHEARIRQGLANCIEQFNASDWSLVLSGQKTFEVKEENPFLVGPTPTDTLLMVESAQAEELLIDLRPQQYEIWSLLSTIGQVSRYSHSYGLSYLVYQDVGRSWLFPIVISLSRMQINPQLLESTSWNQIDFQLFQPGASAMYKLYPRLLFYNHLQLPIGRESLRNLDQGTETTRFMTGIIHSHGLLLKPERSGWAAGVGVIQRFYNSEVYKRDIGIRFQLGYFF